VPRHRFGADLTAVLWRAITLADGTADILQLARNGGPISAYLAESGGSVVTDLQTPLGVALAGGTITADGNGWADFLGPSTTPDTVELWLEAGTLLDGTIKRQRIVAADLGPTVITNAGIVTQHTTDLAALDGRLDIVEAGRGREVAFTVGGPLVTGAGTFRWYNTTGRALAIAAARASVGTAPAGAAVVVDVNVNGTTIYGTQANRPSIPAGLNTSGRMTGHSVLTVPVDAYVTADVDAVGVVGTPGANLGVQIELVG
jgi:hypothetical protein